MSIYLLDGKDMTSREAAYELIAREMDAQFFSKVQASSQEDSPDSGTLDLMRSLAQKYPELLIAMLKREEPTSGK